MFILKPRMSTFQWNKPHSKILCGSKGMVKTVSKCHFSVSISKRFEHFWAMITSKYYELFNYPWLTYFKLFIGAGDQNLLMGTKCSVYKAYSPVFLFRPWGRQAQSSLLDLDITQKGPCSLFWILNSWLIYNLKVPFFWYEILSRILLHIANIPLELVCLGSHNFLFNWQYGPF